MSVTAILPAELPIKAYTKEVSLRCTCGAYPPEDARFCHKCARPLHDDVVVLSDDVATASLPVPPPLPVSTLPKVGFGNTRAVTITLVVAGCAVLAIMLLGLVAPFLMPVVLCGAGFLAVSLYNRRSLQPPTTSDGARLGWMTGLWLFLMTAVVVALISVAISDPGFREQMKQMPTSVPEVVKLLDNPHQFVMTLLGDLVMFFFFLTLLPGLGGILGAKLLTRRGQSS